MNISQYFSGWVNNEMALILMLIQHVRERDPKTLERMQQFLEDMEHHFTVLDSRRPLYWAYRYLAVYLRVYPHVKTKSAGRAVEMIGRIYDALGLEFKCRHLAVNLESAKESSSHAPASA